MILDCLTAFQVINEKESLIINKSLFFKQICHNVHGQIYGTFCFYLKSNSMYIPKYRMV